MPTFGSYFTAQNIICFDANAFVANEMVVSDYWNVSEDLSMSGRFIVR